VFVLNTPNADTTGADGLYKTGAPATGTYAIRAERTGYQTKVMTNVSLQSGVITTIDLPLSPLVGTESVEKVDIMRVSPAPFEDFLRVELQQGSLYSSAIIKLRLIDFSGKIILEKEASPSGVTVLDGLKKLPAGTYLLQASSEKGGVQVLSVIKI
jgi:hypothetical protein